MKVSVVKRLVIFPSTESIYNTTVPREYTPEMLRQLFNQPIFTKKWLPLSWFLQKMEKRVLRYQLLDSKNLVDISTEHHQPTGKPFKKDVDHLARVLRQNGYPANLLLLHPHLHR